MARMGSFRVNGLKEFQKELNSLQNPDEFVQDCAKELAARMLALVIKDTPVGDYSGEPYTCASGQKHQGNKVSGMVGGTLRRGWTGNKKVSAQGYAESLTVNHVGNTYEIEIINPVEYASYVEYGHRTVNHRKWVKGHFMMTMSADEIQRASPKILERKIKKYLERCMK